MDICMPKEITLEYLEKLDKGMIIGLDDKPIEFPNLVNDRNFKIFFKSNERMMKRFLKTVLHLDMNITNMNIKFVDKEVLENNLIAHGSTFDFFININNVVYLDLEMNAQEFELVKNKSLMYLLKNVTTSLNIGEDYSDINNKEFLQLNLNATDESDSGEEIVMFYNITTKETYTNNIITYLRYLDYYNKKYYNDEEEKSEADHWLALLTSKSFTEMYKILDSFLDNRFRDEIIREVIRLSMGCMFTKQELINLEKQVKMDTERYFTNKGAKENSKAVAKNMLAKQMSDDDILELTGLTKEELEEIKNI